MKTSNKPYNLSVLKNLILIFFSLGLFFNTYAQSNQINNFPIYNQNDDPGNIYVDDCGPWAVASILAYWNNHSQFPYTKFDRFLGSDFEDTEIERVASLAQELHVPLQSNSDGGTHNYNAKSGIEDFCNDATYAREYDFEVTLYGEFVSLNIWDKVKLHIDDGEPMLVNVKEGNLQYALEGMSYWMQYGGYADHFMPVIGYDENFIGEKALIVSSMLGEIWYIRYSKLNDLVLNPWFWRIVPKKLHSEIPICSIDDLSNSTLNGSIELTSKVVSESYVSFVEYEIQIDGGDWIPIDYGANEADDYKITYNTEVFMQEENVQFRSRAKDYFTNYSDWSYTSLYAIDNYSSQGIYNGKISNRFPYVDENVEFSIDYVNSGNTPPSGVRVFIDATGYAMTKDPSDDDFTDGVEYTFTSSFSEVKIYNYSFGANAYDGTELEPYPEDNSTLQFVVQEDNQSLYPPYIKVTYPNNEVCHDECFISWEDSDYDNNAEISLYFDTDASGHNGTLINVGDPLYEDDVNGYVWNTIGMQEGEYWIYAVIDDGTSQDHDYSPGTIEIKHPELNSDFILSSFTMEEREGDGDGIVESGEEFNLDVRITNGSSSKDYFLVEGVLNSSNNSIVISDDDSYYGTVGEGNSEWGDDDFGILVDEGFVGSIDFELDLEFSDENGYEYYGVIGFTVNISEDVAPSFEIVGIEVVDDGSRCNGDGVINSGENSVEYRLMLRNNGDGTAYDLEATVAAIDQFETSVSNADYEPIGIGASAWPEGDDHFHINDIPNDFTGTVSSDLTLVWGENSSQTIPFVMEVQPAPKLSVSPNENDFGIESLGETAVIPIGLSNYGTSDLIISSIEDVNTDVVDLVSGVSFPLTISSGNSLSVDINITRDEQTNVNESFLVHSNNHLGSPEEILVSGTFYNPQPAGYSMLWTSSSLDLTDNDGIDNCDWLATGDFDNDGLIDIALDGNLELEIWEQKALNSMEFEHKFTYSIPGLDPHVMALQVGNCDGDAYPDIVIREQDEDNSVDEARIRIFEAVGNDQYASKFDYLVSMGSNDKLTVGNCDNDALDEIVWIDQSDNTITMRVLNSTGSDNYTHTYTSSDLKENYGNSVSYPGIGDVNGDGINEIVLTGDDKYLFIWEYNNGYSLIHPALMTHSIDPEWGDDVHVEVCDVDNDNANEVILTGDGEDGWQLVVIDPLNWQVEFRNNIGLYGDFHSSAAYDLNGNSIPEIFIGEDDSPQRLLAYEYSEGSYFEIFQSENLGDDVYNIEPIDLNADGVSELIVSVDSYFQIWGYEEVSELPDLQIASNNLQLSETELEEDDVLTITAIIQNIGNAGATDIPIEFYIGSVQNENRIDSISIASLESGEAKQITINWTPSQAGSFELITVIDRETQIEESNSDNNIVYKTILVVDNDVEGPEIIDFECSVLLGDSDELP